MITTARRKGKSVSDSTKRTLAISTGNRQLLTTTDVNGQLQSQITMNTVQTVVFLLFPKFS
jgi:hypothetical protein